MDIIGRINAPGSKYHGHVCPISAYLMGNVILAAIWYFCEFLVAYAL